MTLSRRCGQLGGIAGLTALGLRALGRKVSRVRKLAAFALMALTSGAVMLVTARAGFTAVESYLMLVVVGTPVLVACGALAEGIGPRQVRNRRGRTSR